MIIGERVNKFHLEDLGKSDLKFAEEPDFTNIIAEGVISDPDYNPNKNFLLREATFAIRRLGRPLTDKEMSHFEFDKNEQKKNSLIRTRYEVEQEKKIMTLEEKLKEQAAISKAEGETNGKRKATIQIAKNLIGIISNEMIAKKVGLPLSEVEKLAEEVEKEKKE